MRKVMLMLAAMALMVSLFAVVAYAADIQGTKNRDLLTESQRGDMIKALAGPDDVDAGFYEKSLTPGGLGDRDAVHGNRGKDLIDLVDSDGKDIAWGGKGIDECFGDNTDVGDGGDKFFGCEFINGVEQ